MRLQMFLRSRRPISRVPPLAGLPMGWTQEQRTREISAWFWRQSRDGISRLEVRQQLGPEGEDGPWLIWTQIGLLHRGPISLHNGRLPEAFETPLDAISCADLLDQSEWNGATMAWSR